MVSPSLLARAALQDSLKATLMEAVIRWGNILFTELDSIVGYLHF